MARRLFESEFRDESDFTLLYLDDELNQPNDVAAEKDSLEKESLEKHSLEKDSFEKDWWYRYCCFKVDKPDDRFPRITSFEFQEEVKEQTARLQVSRMSNATGWSVTVRWTPPEGFVPGREGPDPQIRLDQRRNWLQNTDWEPRPKYGYEKDGARAKNLFLFSIRDVIEFLYKYIVTQANPNPRGLILVTGATNAAKSECARGLVWRRLDDIVEETRPLRLVTYEDPIEKRFAPLNSTNHFPPFDVTQRGAQRDCWSLDEALTAALRQTPDVFYIGEIRTEPDLRYAVEFGGTGHLVIATAHAGSLVEAVAKLLRAAEQDKLGSRAVYVPKILAVVHMKKFPVTVSLNGEPRTVNALVPDLYRRTSVGMQDLIADGLASILPHFPEQDEKHAFGSLGRQFSTRQLSEVSRFFQNTAIWKPEEAQSAKSALLHRAFEEDLNA